MKTTYVPGSDKKTVKLAAVLVNKINSAIAALDFTEAERLIAIGCNAANRPFRAEFKSQSEKDI